MKKLLISALLMALSIGSWAVPARPGQWKMIKLADGSEVRAELRGDEHCHYWQTEDNRIFVFDAETQFYKETLRENLKYDMPMSFSVQSGSSIGGPRKSLGVPHTEPVTGTMKGLVVLVQFSDVKFQEGHDKDLYNRILNEKGYSDPSINMHGSVNDYFMDQSDGQFDFQFDIVGPVTLSGKSTYYGGETGYDNMKQFVSEALEQIKADVNFATYDNDKDGYVDEVFFVFAGKGLNDGGTNCIWPHMFWYKSSWGGYFKQNRVQVDTYACANEITSWGTLTGIGTFCHEFSHCLDIPDMYDTVNGDHPLGHYSVMDFGCYNGSGKGYLPAGYTAYERDFCGWRKIEELTENASFDNLKAINEGGVAFKMTNQAKPDEYFIVEPRRQTAWDKDIYNSGFLIYHIDYTKPVDWTSNVVNTSSKNATCHNNVSIVKAGGSTDYEDLYTFPYRTKNAFCDVTDASTNIIAPELFYANSDGTKKLHKGVYDMKKNSDGTFSFRYEADAEYTGIEDIHQRQDVNGYIYNLSGQRVSAGYKGVQIVNGKKVLR